MQKTEQYRNGSEILTLMVSPIHMPLMDINGHIWYNLNIKSTKQTEVLLKIIKRHQSHDIPIKCFKKDTLQGSWHLSTSTHLTRNFELDWSVETSQHMLLYCIEHLQNCPILSQKNKVNKCAVFDLVKFPQIKANSRESLRKH